MQAGKLRGESVRKDLRATSLVVCSLLVLSLIPISSVAAAFSAQLDPISLSFPNPQKGYVLSLYDCAAKTCATLRGTVDGGSTWSAVPIPSELGRRLRLESWGTYGTTWATLSVHFADAKDGWIYGTVPAPVTSTTSNPNSVNRLWSTHDGGKTWHQVRLDPLSLTGGVVQMATHGVWTYLFGESNSGDAYLLGTRSNVDQWANRSSAELSTPAGGTQLVGSFTFEGDNGWFVAGNDRSFTASARLVANGTWGAWNGPSFKDFGSSYSPIDAVTDRVLLAEGQSALIVYPPGSSVPSGWNNGASWLFISYDAGTTFKPFRKLSSSYQGSYYSTVPGLPAVPIPGTILLQQQSNSSYRLVRSTNWGRTWNVVFDGPVSQILFTSHAKGFAIAREKPSRTNYSVYRTIDAGSHWNKVRL
jgi:hypothetical protein